MASSLSRSPQFSPGVEVFPGGSSPAAGVVLAPPRRGFLLGQRGTDGGHDALRVEVEASELLARLNPGLKKSSYRF